MLTISSITSPLPRIRRYRPLSSSKTRRTTDCSASYCSLVMGAMARFWELICCAVFGSMFVAGADPLVVDICLLPSCWLSRLWTRTVCSSSLGVEFCLGNFSSNFRVCNVSCSFLLVRFLTLVFFFFFFFLLEEYRRLLLESSDEEYSRSLCFLRDEDPRLDPRSWW